MSVGDWRVGVHPGDGAVARFGDCVLVVLPDDDAQREAVTELLALARQSAAEGGGGDMVRRLAGFLADRPPAELPSLGAVASVESGVAVLVRGDVDVQLKSGPQTDLLSGRDAVTWVDRIVEADFDEAVVETSGGGGHPHPHGDLGEGIVPGGGASLWPAGAAVEPPTEVQPSEPEPEVPVPTAALPPEPQPSADFVPISFDEPVEDEEEDEREPLPVAGEVPPAPAEDEGPLVQGVLCSRNHFNDPNSLFCATCGISMVHQTHNLVDGPRPALGVMVVDDGSSYVLESDYVIGRDPEQADDVVHGHSRAILLPDVKKAISRVHARIRLDGWNVTVADAGSANGTFVAQPGDQNWTRVSDAPVAISPGTTVRVGHRTMMFDSHRRKS